MAPPLNIGDSLREARIRKGLSIKDVEDVTKIRGKYLEALEEDDFEVLPGPTYVKGFLRQYALFLRLDADELIEIYRIKFEPRGDDAPVIRAAEMANQRRTPTSAERKQRRARRHQRGYALVAVVAIVVVALLAWFGTSRSGGNASINAENISTATVSTDLGAADTDSTDSPDSSDTTVADTTDTTKTVQATVSSTVDTTSAGDSDDGGQVKMVLSVGEGSCWLVVRQDGEEGAEVFAGTLSEGGQQTFDQAKRYWMNVGEPELLTVSVGGKSYTLAAPAGAFLVTEDGVERSQ